MGNDDEDVLYIGEIYTEMIKICQTLVDNITKLEKWMIYPFSMHQGMNTVLVGRLIEK